MVTKAESGTEEPLKSLRELLARVEEDDRKACDYLDRVALIGGSGAILVSLSFVKDFAPQPTLSSARILIASWILFLLGSGLGLVSLVSARQAARAFARVLKKKIGECESELCDEDYQPIRRPNNVTRICNYGALSGFCLGSVLLVIFAVCNFPPRSGQALDDLQKPALALGQPQPVPGPVIDQCKVLGCRVTFGYVYEIPAAPPSVAVSGARPASPAATEPNPPN